MISAIATSRLGTLGLCAGSIYRFNKDQKVSWRISKPLVLIAALGTVLGVSIVVSFDDSLIREAVAVFMLLSVPIIFMDKGFGTRRRRYSRKRNLVGYLIYFLLMIYAGAIGAGTGPLIFISLITFFGLRIIEANATDMVSWLAVALISIIIFSYQGYILYPAGLVLMAGMLLGGYTGARFASTLGDNRIKAVFAVMVIMLSLSLLL
jgi:hypothetical protein